MEMVNGRLQLPMVTLVAMTSVNIDATIDAMVYSMREIDFGDAVLITHEKPKNLPQTIRYAYIEELTDIDKFNYDCVYRLGDYIQTEFALLVHSDGFVVNPQNWRDEFLDYDYIGSPWPFPKEGDDTTYRDIHGNLSRVGNSVGLRSKRLMDFPKQTNMPWTPEKGWYNEDGFICCRNKHLFEAAGMKFAPIELACYFGRENVVPEMESIPDLEPFVFHKWAGPNAKYPCFDRTQQVDFAHKVWRKIRKFLKLK